MKTDYTAAEIATACHRHQTNVLRRATKEGWPFELKRVQGGYRKDYLYAHLPPDIQDALIRDYHIRLTKWAEEKSFINDALPQGHGHPGHDHGLEARATVPVPAPPAPPPQISAWDQKKREKAQRRFALIERARTRKGDLEAKKALAAEAGVSYGSLQRWLRAADAALEAVKGNGGGDPLEAQLAALAPRYGRRRGVRRAFDEEAIGWALKRVLNQSHLTIRDIHEDLLIEARIQDWRTGSCDTLHRILRERVPEAALIYAREGKRRFEARCVVKKLRRYDDLPPLFCLVGDHHILDAFVHVPGATPKRPWLTAWLDLRSRAFVGWTWSFQPNARIIALALRHAILPKNRPDLPMHGLPISTYIDNGKDYRALSLRGEEIDIGRIDYPEWFDQFRAVGIDPFYLDMQYDPHDETWKLKRGGRELVVKGVRVGGVFSRLAIRSRFATAYHPWAKPIERVFGEVVRSFSRRLPGWCGSHPGEKPERLAFELKNPAGNLLTIEQLNLAWEAWLAEVYHERPQSGHGMDGLSPRQVWDSLAQRQTIDPAFLDFALLEHNQVKIQAWGFRLPKVGEYELWHPEQSELAALLNELHGQRVNVLYDPGHPEAVRVYHRGRFACWARTTKRGSYVTDEGMAEHARLQALQRRQIQDALAALGAEPEKPLPGLAQSRLELVRAAELPPAPEPPALPEPEEAAPAADAWQHPAGISEERPEFFDSAFERAQWICKQRGLGRPLSEADQGFIEGYLPSHPEVAEGLLMMEQFIKDNGGAR